eukprot:COSAG02_NODE_26757_length_625_cov_1.136882_1_plen_98_part_10
MRAASVGKQALRRLCHDVLLSAAMCRLGELPCVSVAQMAREPGVHRNTVYAALEQNEKLAVIAKTDKQERDGLSGHDCLNLDFCVLGVSGVFLNTKTV